MRIPRIVVAFMLVVAGALILIRPALAASNEFVQSGYAPHTDGTTLVWVTMGDEPTIYAARMADRQPFVVKRFLRGHSFASLPMVGGNLVVWQEYTDSGDAEIRGKNLATGDEFDVATTATYEALEGISGTRVLSSVWTDGQGGPLHIWDIANPGTPLTLTTLPEGWVVKGAAISGNRVAWAEATQRGLWILKVAEIGEAPEIVAQSSDSSFQGLDLVGDTLVYIDASEHVTVVDLASGSSRTLSDVPTGVSPTTNGRYVFWNPEPPSPPCGLCRVEQTAGYDLLTDSSFQVADDELVAQARGDVVVWGWPDLPYPDGHAVHVATIRDILPSAPRPDPGKVSPNWLYFSAAGHYLSFGFKDFWARSGSVAAFGFPLTEEFSELSPDSGRMFTVQYLERQRYEYHPEFKGSPYEVELGRLGAEDAARRNLSSSRPFVPMPSLNVDNGCRYFPATQHAVCGAFLAYWQQHGVELSDAGLSYRESLALFGYPISEPFTDPESGLTVQYFERARFEWHPENSPGWQVELGRLGADTLTGRGW